MLLRFSDTKTGRLPHPPLPSLLGGRLRVLLTGLTLWLGFASGVCAAQPIAQLSPRDFLGTMLASPLSPEDQATSLVRAMNEVQSLPALPYTLVRGTAKYESSSPFVMVATSSDRTYYINWFPLGGTGGVTEYGRSSAALTDRDSRPAIECCPTGESICGAPAHEGEKFLQASSLPEVLFNVMPAVLKAKGVDASIVSVVAAPDISFEVTRGGQIWMMKINPTDIHDLLRSHTPLNRLTYDSLLSRIRITRGHPSYLDGHSFRDASVTTAVLALGLWICTGVLIHWQLKSSHRWVNSFGVKFMIMAMPALAITCSQTL